MPLLLTCEHARHALPDGEDLGLSAEVMRSHVSYDRGALEYARALSRLTSAPLHEGRFSRLWVDLNRRTENPAAILAETYGIVVPGNRDLEAAARESRLSRVHRPWRVAVLADARRLAQQGPVLHLSLHSFDPTLDPEARAFDVGVLCDEARAPERAIAVALVQALHAGGDTARLNEPYLGTPEGTTSWLREHFAPEAYAGLEIEASQGWMHDEASLSAFADRLAAALPS